MTLKDKYQAQERTILDGPVTSRELDRIRRRLREPPAPELHLTPGGGLELAIKRIHREEDAIRASFISRSLSDVRGAPKCDFDRSR
jgi:hypothetical protein